MTEGLNSTTDIKTRIAVGKEAFNKESTLRESKLIFDAETGKMFYMQCYFIWYRNVDSKKEDKQRVKVFGMLVWPRLVNTSWKDRVSNEEILKRNRVKRNLLKLKKLARPLFEKGILISTDSGGEGMVNGKKKREKRSNVRRRTSSR